MDRKIKGERRGLYPPPNALLEYENSSIFQKMKNFLQKGFLLSTIYDIIKNSV